MSELQKTNRNYLQCLTVSKMSFCELDTESDAMDESNKPRPFACRSFARLTRKEWATQSLDMK